MPKGYVNIAVRLDLYGKLEEIRDELKFKSMSDVIAHLIKIYEDYSIGLVEVVDGMSKLNSTLNEIKKKIEGK
jgi:predicted CopG family antitoxin